MNRQSIKKLMIDPEFRKVIPPLLPEEHSLLEEDILRNGCLNPLMIWHGLIADGHHRYEICQRHRIPFEVMELEVETREEVINWICAHQLGRRNLTDESRRYLIGKRYEMEKQIGTRNKAGLNQYSQGDLDRSKICTKPNLTQAIKTRARERLSDEYHMTPQTIANYARFARAIDRIENVTPDLSSGILRGEIKVAQERVVDLARGTESDIEQFEQEIAAHNGNKSRYLDTRLISMARKLSGQVEPETKLPAGRTASMERSVKDVPVDDPDQAASTLTLTIPSWIGMLNRTQTQMDVHAVSEAAIQSLRSALIDLRETIETIMKITEVHTDGRDGL